MTAFIFAIQFAAIALLLVLIAFQLNRIAQILERREQLAPPVPFSESLPFVRDAMTDSLRGPVPDMRAP